MTASRRSFLKGMVAVPAAIGGLSITAAWSAAPSTLTVAITKPAGDLNPHKYAGLWEIGRAHV